MLQVKNISKLYRTGDIETKALDDVSLNFRDSEFVSILGASGSGKSTLLNIIGGLDKYTEGDLIIDKISTKRYNNRDWDTYRNSRIGFVFQSYNLIQHQTILSNVELALTISGVSKSESYQRAKKALEEVGLGDQIHKKPTQLSGGQMQRVAIARALVNNPDIILADEPTGALDTVTSVQIMEILKKIAKNRLVIMVTHNPELARKYSTRIVELRDGHIISDSEPFEVPEENISDVKPKNSSKKAKMSFFTSLRLSFNNLKTKKGRTFLTSLAGSIGIIGIALILSISSGVQVFVDQFEKDTAGSLPISIEDQAVDLNSLMSASANKTQSKLSDEQLDSMNAVSVDFDSVQRDSNTGTSFSKKNNTAAFKEYLDDPESEIYKCGIQTKDIVYDYNTAFSVFTHDSNEQIVDTGVAPSEILNVNKTNNTASNQFGMNVSVNTTPKNLFFKLLPGADQKLISDAIEDENRCCKLVYGEMPKNEYEMILVLDDNNTLPADTLYRLGFISLSEYKSYLDKAKNDIEFEDLDISYKDICEKEFYLVPSCDQYKDQGTGVFSHIDSTSADYSNMVNNGMKLKISGIVRKTGQSSTLLTSTVGFTSALAGRIVDHTDVSAVVKAQDAKPDANILTGIPFSNLDDEQKIEITREYIEQSGKFPGDVSSLSRDTLLNIYKSDIGGYTYEGNMEAFGKVDYSKPQKISIYSNDLDQKNAVKSAIDNYNNRQSDAKDKIIYTDPSAFISNALSNTVNVIQIVMIAIASISLLVSAIMIGIITHISVLERTKEIGVLRALGASKKNVTRVFTAETCIVGFLSGLIGVLICLLLIVPINMVVSGLNLSGFSAQLPILYVVLLVVLSTVITVIGGLAPSKKAAKLDPVVALRSE